jgi:hypothetical protein
MIVLLFVEHLSKRRGGVEADVGKETKRAEIITSIRDELAVGRGVIPLIGSGMSAASGIPSGADYRAYLFHCLTRVFDGASNVAWDPSTLLWPSLSEVPKIDDLSSHMISWSHKLQQDLAIEIGKSRDSRQTATDRAADEDRQARWQASGVSADWRATLHLLSRVGPENGRIRIKDPDPLVVDSFFVNLTQGKRPNAAHSLLAHLADALRIEVMLTTNFDNLLETAFHRLDMPIATFDVHYDAGLPDDRLVRARRSLVKLHGGRYGLRADFSLDNHPQQADIDTFCSYLAPYCEDSRSSGTHDASRDLLVMGVSGQERRTVGLVCHALKEFPNLKVHWTCYSESDVDLVRTAFEEAVEQLRRRLRPAPKHLSADRVVTALAPDLTLFLLELHQHIFLCLPPSRVGFPAIWPAPPSPLQELTNPSPATARSDASEARSLRFKENATQLVTCIENVGRSDRVAGRVVLVHGPAGASSVASEAYSRLNGFSRIWLDLKPAFDEADFAFLVLESLAREAGVAPPFPLERDALRAKTSDAELRQLLLEQLTRQTPRTFAIFINARDLPAHAIWEDDSAYGPFAEAVRWLGSDRNITVVVVSWDSFHVELARKLDVDKLADSAAFDAFQTEDFGIGSSAEISGKVLSLLEEKNTRRFWRFVLGLTLIRHPCHLSALHSWALLPSLSRSERDEEQKARERDGRDSVPEDNDDERSVAAEKFLGALRRELVIRDNAGNNVFMYLEYRKSIGELIERSAWGMSEEGRMARAEAHQGIADWYIKLYRSSGEVNAVFESIYHRLKCVTHSQALPNPTNGALIQASVTEIGVALDLLEPDVDSSARPLTLVHIWNELLSEMRKLRELEGYPELRRHRHKLTRMRDLYLSTIGETLTQEEQDETFVSSPFSARSVPLSPDPGPVFIPTPPPSPMPSSTPLPSYVPPPSVPPSLTPSSGPVSSRRSGEATVPEQELREPHYLLWSRKYDAAAHKIEGIIGQLLGWPPDQAQTLVQGCFAPTLTGDQLRKTAREWAQNHSGAWAKDAVKALRRYHLSELYRAEVVRLVANQRSLAGNDDSAMRKSEREMLERAERIYLLSAELMRYVDDTSTLQGENALLRAQAGILLSWMSRPREAQRRYVEAYGYLSYISGPARPARWAAVDLRRTETFLCQLEMLGAERGGPEGMQRRLGHIYDAVAGFERASYKVQESAVNIRWYSWLREIELAVCLEIARLDVAEHRRFSRCRDREGLDEWFAESLEGGIYRVLNDSLRLARYYDLGREFLVARKRECRTREKIEKSCAKAEGRLRTVRDAKMPNLFERDPRGSDEYVALYQDYVVQRWESAAV